ncbi:MAG: hypothetical protein V3V01_14080 [Acidimicrobiales bacterium]
MEPAAGIAAPGVPIANLDNPTAQQPLMQPAQPAANVIAQQVQTPPTQQVLSTAAPPAAPAGAAAPAQAISPEFPIEHNGQQLMMKDVLATHDLASELRLGDPNMAEFLRTVSLAYRGDGVALQQLQAINDSLQPPVQQPVGAPAAPVAAPAPVPVAQAPAPVAGAVGQPASGGLPTTQPASPVLPSGVAEHLTKGVLGVINQSIKPLMDDMNARKSVEELAQIGDFLKGREKDYPNLSRNPTAAAKIRTQWNDAVAVATRNKTARPDGADLERMIRAEEAYVASSVPAPQNNSQPGVEITRMDQPNERIPGRPVPGRPAPGPLDAVQGMVRPSAVATTVDGVPGAAPGVEPQVAAPMNQAALGTDLQQQFREMAGGR